MISALYNQAAGQAQQQVARFSDVIKDQLIASALVAVGSAVCLAAAAIPTTPTSPDTIQLQLGFR